MTLIEAIEHCKDMAKCEYGECAEEHRQLAEWLMELQYIKTHGKHTETHGVCSVLISRQDAIEAVKTKIKKWNAVDGEGCHVGLGLRYTDVIYTLNELPSAETQPITCDGCKHVGTYDTDFPCSSCIRREKDYYEPEE